MVPSQAKPSLPSGHVLSFFVTCWAIPFLSIQGYGSEIPKGGVPETFSKGVGD